MFDATLALTTLAFAVLWLRARRHALRAHLRVERWRQQADVSEQFANSWEELARERALIIEEKDLQIAELRAVAAGRAA